MREECADVNFQDYATFLALFDKFCDGRDISAFGAISAVHSVLNSGMASVFMQNNNTIFRRMREQPELFNKTDWNQMDRGALRTWSLQRLQRIISNYGWNEHQRDQAVLLLTL